MTAKRITSDGRDAPTLLVGFACPAKGCDAHTVRDAYAGPVSCSTGHPKTFMEPLDLLRNLEGAQRLACIDGALGYVPEAVTA